MLKVECIQIITIIIAVCGLIVSSVSLFVAIRTHRMSLFSQKLQNAQTLVNSFYSSLRKNDLEEFRNIIMLRGESAGGDNNGHYMGEDGQLHDFSEYFMEGAPDGGALGRIIDNLNRVCFFAKNESVNLQFVYSELGHFVNISCEILEAMHKTNDNHDEGIICFKELCQKYYDVPVKVIGLVEE